MVRSEPCECPWRFDRGALEKASGVVPTSAANVQGWSLTQFYSKNSIKPIKGGSCWKVWKRIISSLMWCATHKITWPTGKSMIFFTKMKQKKTSSGQTWWCPFCRWITCCSWRSWKNVGYDLITIDLAALLHNKITYEQFCKMVFWLRWFHKKLVCRKYWLENM